MHHTLRPPFIVCLDSVLALSWSVSSSHLRPSSASSSTENDHHTTTSACHQTDRSLSRLTTLHDTIEMLNDVIMHALAFFRGLKEALFST